MMTSITQAFISTAFAQPTGLYTLSNQHGTQVHITNYGARIVSLNVLDRQGNLVDTVLGFDSLEGYLNSTDPFHGAIIGRFANRISLGVFTLNNKKYHLPVNNVPNHLHGGSHGFHNQVWEVRDVSNQSVSLHYYSPDLEGGYPGNMDCELTYKLTDENELLLEYRATVDQDCPVNLTSHPFFNLNGLGSGSILNHEIQIDADAFCEVNASLIPVAITDVTNTPFDFRLSKKAGADMQWENDQLEFGLGYDHNMVLRGSGFRKVAQAVGNKTGICLEVFTDQPGMQFYTGNHMKGQNILRNGIRDEKQTAFCFETQHYPDAPNQPDYPDTILKAGVEFYSKTSYRYAAR